MLTFRHIPGAGRSFLDFSVIGKGTDMWDEKMNGENTESRDGFGADTSATAPEGVSSFNPAGNMPETGPDLSASAGTAAGPEENFSAHTYSDSYSGNTGISGQATENTGSGPAFGAYSEGSGTSGYSYENTFRDSFDQSRDDFGSGSAYSYNSYAGGSGSSYGGNQGTGAASGSYAGGSGSSYGGSQGTGAASGSYAGGSGSTGPAAGGPDLLYSSEKRQRDLGGEKAGATGHYYNYNRNDAPGTGTPAGRGGSGSGGARKGKGVLAYVLAVVLIFILGAGAGSYIQGRSSTASLQSGASASGAKEDGSARTGTENRKDKETTESEKPDSGQAEKEDDSPRAAQESSAGELTSISTVQKVDAKSSGADTVVADVAENVMPAIVSVYNKFTEESQFFGRSYTHESESTGSGIIIGESDGELLIVTNNHVVEGADSLSVQFIDENNCEAALKGTDAASDLAVIAVKISDLSAQTRDAIAIAELGDSDALRIGERVIAIGNALGYGQSVTVGYVSAKNREFSEEDGITGTFIQTDAAINPGNSGGALLDVEGQVIGINSNKIGGEAVEGMGFAIPISKAIPIIDNLKEQESKTKVSEEERGVLGIYGISVTSDVASAYGLPVGAYVEEIIEGSGAANSDLQQGDIITAINGSEVTSMESLSSQMTYYAVGTEVTLTIQHPIDGGDYEEREIKVTLSRSSDLQTQQTEGRDMRGEEQYEEEIPQEDISNIFGFPFGNFGF